MANLCIKTPSSASLVLIFQLLVLRPRPTGQVLGFDFVFVFVCYVFVEFSVVFVELYFGFDICPPPLSLLLPPDQVLSLPMSAGGTPTNTNHHPFHHYLRHISHISCIVKMLL